MAAPMETHGSSEENSDITDPLSDSFDPIKALYSPSIKLPVPDARQFNNLAEFENFVNKKDAKSLALSQKKKEKLPGIIAQRAAMQAKEAVRKKAIMSNSSTPKEITLTQQRKQRSTNVLNNMERYDKGPMSILHRCVNERLRVIVVVRAAVSVRSHCRGYIIAFDKHMNMALMDVDEKYIKPVVTKSEGEKKNKTEKESDTKPLKDTKSDRKPFQDSSKCCIEESGSKGSASRSADIDLRHKLSISSQRMRSRQRDDQYTMSDSDINHSNQSHKQTKSQSDSETTYRQERTSEGTDGQKVSKKKKAYTPFWPLYKQWTENRCYASYEIVDRHINQLFIRGDNVVSVSIAT